MLPCYPHKIVFNPLTAGADYIRFLIFLLDIAYQFLNMVKIKRNTNQ